MSQRDHTQRQSRPPLARLSLLSLVCLLLVACGTIVGNPRKPTDGGGDGDPTPAPSAIRLPIVEFEVPEEAKEFSFDEPSFSLHQDSLLAKLRTNQDNLPTDNTPLQDWARRTDGVVKELNALINRVNRIIEDDRLPEDSDGRVRFQRRGFRSGLSGSVGPAAAGSEFEFDAVICFEDEPVKVVRWNSGEARVEVIRDFAKAARDGQVSTAYVSRVSLERSGDEIIFRQNSIGTWTNNLVEDPQERGQAEVTLSRRNRSTQQLTLSTTLDRFADRPSDGVFVADRYLVGEIAPDENDRLDTRFLAYDRLRRGLCRNGFDESAEDLWAPATFAERSFCLGRGFGGPGFDDFDHFLATHTALEEIGILSEAELEDVTMPDTYSCEDTASRD